MLKCNSLSDAVTYIEECDVIISECSALFNKMEILHKGK